MTNMISIARASSYDYKYPTKHEVISMAKRLVEYYPMIKDKSTGSSHEWVTSFAWIFIVKTCFTATIIFQNYSLFCCTGHCCQKAHETTFKYLKSCEGQTPSIKRARLDEVRLLQWLKVESDADSSQQLIHHHLQDQAPHIKKMTALMKYVCTFKFTTKCTSIVFAVNNIIFGNILYVSLILPHLFLCFVYSWIV